MSSKKLQKLSFPLKLFFIDARWSTPKSYQKSHKTKIIILMKTFKKSRKVCLSKKWRILIQLRWMFNLRLNPIPSNFKHPKPLIKRRVRNIQKLFYFMILNPDAIAKAICSKNSSRIPTEVTDGFASHSEFFKNFALNKFLKCLKTKLILMIIQYCQTPQNYPNYLISYT